MATHFMCARVNDGCHIIHTLARTPRTREKPFDRMNGIAASLMLNLTSSVRFKGSLNGDGRRRVARWSTNLVHRPPL